MNRRGPVRAAAALLAAALAVPVPAESVPTPDPSTETSAVAVFRLQDERITESSGLVDLGDLMVTTNDSGDVARLFTLDSRTGRTVGTTDYGVDVVDVEALAPAGRRSVWVGDIGDNRRVRETVAVHRVVVGRGRSEQPATTFRLRYPDGAHDAESLVVDGRGRLHVITKSFGGGDVYRAPRRLRADAVTTLAKVGHVDDLATDAALLPGGRHLLVRGPWAASVHEFPSLEPLGTFELPAQQQGEAVSVGPGGRIRLSSEGARTPVLEVALPAEVANRIGPSAAEPGSKTSAAAPPRPAPRRTREPAVAVAEPWLPWTLPVVLLLGAVGIRLGLRRRPE